MSIKDKMIELVRIAIRKGDEPLTRGDYSHAGVAEYLPFEANTRREKKVDKRTA